MTSSEKKSNQLKIAAERGSGLLKVPTPSLDETRHYRDTISDHARTTWMDEAPTLMLPVVAIDQMSTLILPVAAIDQMPTWTGLRSLPRLSPSSYSLFDSLLIEEQPTSILAVIPAARAEQESSSLEKGTASHEYLTLIHTLVKNSGIYAISSLASPLVTLLLSPFLAHMLSRTDFGALMVLNTVVAIATGVTELGLGAAFTRVYAYDCKTQREQLDALSTLVLLLLLILIPITAIGVVAAPWLSIILLGSDSYTGAVRVGVLLVLTQNLTVPGLVWLRSESRAAFFSMVSVANLLITAGATIMLVRSMHLGIVGPLVANGLGDAIIIICTFPIIFWRAGFYLRFALAGSMLAFGVPNVMNLISNWVLQLSDRYLLEHFASLSLTAGYSVAYSLGGVLAAAIIAPFSLAWWVLMYPIAKREDAKQVFKVIFRWFSIILLLATFGLSVFGASVLDLLFPTSYHAQAPIIPVIALSTLFNGIFIVVSLGVSLQRKTWLTTLYFVVSALINVGLNIVLIPAYGTMGAALSTLAAYIALMLMSYFINRVIYPVQFEMSLLFVSLGIGIMLYIASDALAQGQNELLAWSMRIGALLLYGGTLLSLGLLASSGKRITRSSRVNS